MPPNNSSRQTDVDEFFDRLLSAVYSFQHEGPIQLCGDFNSRISGNYDYIVGVDGLPDRDVVDFKSNIMVTN